MSWLIISLLVIGGLVLMILELLVVPGTTVVGIVGFILIAVGVWQSFTYGVVEGSIVLAITLFLSVVSVYLSLKSNTWNKAMLHTSIKSKIINKSLELNVGDIGQTVSRVNPMGKAIFKNTFYEVSSFGPLIDENSEVRVVDIANNKIIVELFEADKV